MLVNMKCGAEIKNKSGIVCEGNLTLVLINESEVVKINKERGTIQFKFIETTKGGEIKETDGGKREYSGSKQENLFLLKCNLCGRLFGLSSYFLTDKDNFIHFWKEHFYVLEGDEFNKIIEMSVYPKIGEPTRAEVQTEKH